VVDGVEFVCDYQPDSFRVREPYTDYFGLDPSTREP
jgi:hypothetical protein